MPELEFEGKSVVYAHHLGVEVRTLIPCAKRSEMTRVGGVPSLEGNLVVHGDNLHALKALLPRYEGKVKCIYIDPPYNTGSQAWVYNDRVNNPLMKKWLKENGAVDGEDSMRHDKWLCMMWPRLRLLKELLADDGVIFVSIDDHEQHHLRAIMDEMFGAESFVACVAAIVNLKGSKDNRGFTNTHEYLLVYEKNPRGAQFHELPVDENESEEWQSDEKGWYKVGASLRYTGEDAPRERRPNLFFPIYVQENGTISVVRKNKSDSEIFPVSEEGVEVRWRWKKERIASESDELIVKRSGDTWLIHKKQRPPLGLLPSKKPKSSLYSPNYSSTTATTIVKDIFKGRRIFDYPHSPYFLKDLFIIAGVQSGDIVLDSFAGSGTTAHAVLELNKEDGGKRKFILVECEDYADTTTAERVRRVINGVPNAKKDSLREGSGGTFTYCTLGEALTVENMLQHEKKLPDYATLATHVLWLATGESLPVVPPAAQRGEDGLFFESDQCLYYLVYKAERKFLLSNDSALNITRAERIAKTLAAKKKKEAVVFATQVFLDHKDLAKHHITFSQLPYCLE